MPRDRTEDLAHMIDKKRIRGLSERLLESHYAGTAAPLDPSLFLQDPNEAYWVQEVVLRGLDPRRPISWKVSPPREGVESFGSPTPFKSLQVSAATFPDAGRLLGVEAEVAFRFGRAPRHDGKRAEILDAIDEAFVLIELCQSRFTNWEEVPQLTRVADFQSHGGFALGSGTRDWRGIDFSQQAVALIVNGKQVVANRGSHPSGDPLALAVWAAAHCHGRGMPIAAGDIVTAGTWTGMTKIDPGDEVLARFAGIGEATLRLRAAEGAP
jgi:2-keto-4-pentenoate hydratase/2-oxohepta-3-ene-1,7-dioic acid hydratase in catechol pathway